MVSGPSMNRFGPRRRERGRVDGVVETAPPRRRRHDPRRVHACRDGVRATQEGATADAMQALTKKAKELRSLAASIRATTLDIEDAPLFRVLCLGAKRH